VKLIITCEVPDYWRDVTDDTDIIAAAYSDIVGALVPLGVTDIDTREDESTKDDRPPHLFGHSRACLIVTTPVDKHTTATRCTCGKVT
jgi:hypothetical protein